MFITLSECYCIANKADKAITTVNNAYEYLKDTNYEGEIKIAEAKICMYKNDTKSALKLLNSIKSDQDVFINIIYKMCFYYTIIAIIFQNKFATITFLYFCTL